MPCDLVISRSGATSTLKKIITNEHWGTAMLSLEPIWEPPVRFKANAEKFGFRKEDAITFKIGEIKKLEDLVN